MTVRFDPERGRKEIEIERNGAISLRLYVPCNSGY